MQKKVDDTLLQSISPWRNRWHRRGSPLHDGHATALMQHHWYQGAMVHDYLFLAGSRHTKLASMVAKFEKLACHAKPVGEMS